MKILVLSLLRLGDFLQQAPLLEQLLSEGHDVHVLVNDSLRELEPLFPEVTFHFFGRERLQKILTRPQCNLLTAYARLERELQSLNGEKFDVIENWTHNFLSARLMDLLEAKVKKGARFQEGSLVPLEGALSYVNETWGPTKASSFHWVDALARGMGRRSPALHAADDRSQGAIYLQVLTSDAKKNWQLGKWMELADLLSDAGYEVRVLCAPFEESLLREKGFGRRHALSVPNLAELRQVLSGARLLVTGDTSVAHWAAHLHTPVLALFLGSADPRKTAPRLKGARVLWAEAGCSPCRHRDPCSQAEHVCESLLTTSTVYQEVLQMLNQESASADTARVQKIDVSEGAAGASVTHLRDRRPLGFWAQVVWDFYMNRDHDIPVAPYGTAARLILQNWGVNTGTRDWLEGMKERLEHSFEILGDISEALWEQMREFDREPAPHAQSERRLREATRRLADLWKQTDFVTRLEETLQSSDENVFVRMRRKKEALQEVYELFSVQRNLIKVLDQEMKEKGIRYGARA